jgi:uncharacterized protein YcbK (DUF882 family)
MLAGYDSLPNAVASGDRTISLHHIHTNEEITIVYKRNGRYDPEAMKKLDWFLRDWRREEAIKMDPMLIDLVWEVQQIVGARKPIWVVCGYRAPATNSMLRRRSSGVAQNSMHTVGHAMDFYIPDASLEELRIAGLRLQRGGVGYYPTSGSPFVHLDTGSVRHWPRMTRDQLARVFPDGRTVHIPTDGHPMAGYALALADIERRGGSPSQNSLDAARVAGINTDAIKPKSRNLLAALFGVKEEDDEPTVTTASVAARPAIKPVAIKPVALKRDAIAALVEKSETVSPPPAALPEARRTTAQPQAPALGVKLAAVPMPSSRPARPAAVDPSSPAGLIAARGLWDAGQGFRQLGDPAPFQVAMAGAADSITAPASGALAYVPSFRATPQRKGLVTAIARPKRVASARFDDIWLRALMLTPNLQDFMSVTSIGMSDKDLRPLMKKPTSALTLAFSEDPTGGIATDRFDGHAAVVFLDTVSFVTRTAALHQ